MLGAGLLRFPRQAYPQADGVFSNHRDALTHRFRCPGRPPVATVRAPSAGLLLPQGTQLLDESDHGADAVGKLRGERLHDRGDLLVRSHCLQQLFRLDREGDNGPIEVAGGFRDRGGRGELSVRTRKVMLEPVAFRAGLLHSALLLGGFLRYIRKGLLVRMQLPPLTN